MTRAVRWALLLVCLLVAGCGGDDGVGPVRDSTYTIPAGQATSLDLAVEMERGNLVIDGAATALLDATFYWNEQLEPEIEWAATAERGTLTLTQPSADGAELDHDDRNDWDLHIGPGTPTTLDLNVIAVHTTLDLDDVDLTRLKIAATSGETIVGIGGTQTALEAIEINATSGRVWLVLDGVYPATPTIDLRNTSGDLLIDLNGEWRQDVVVNLTNVSGLVQLVVPNTIGIDARITTVSGSVILTGAQPLRQDGNRYINDALGTAPATLTLRITTTSGGVAIETTE